MPFRTLDTTQTTATGGFRPLTAQSSVTPSVDTSQMPRSQIVPGKFTTAGAPVREYLDTTTGKYVPEAQATFSQKAKALSEDFIDPAIKFVKSGLSAPIDIVRSAMGKPVLPNQGGVLPSGLPNTTFQEDFQNKTLPDVVSGNISPLQGTLDVTSQVVGGAGDFLGVAGLAESAVAKGQKVLSTLTSKASSIVKNTITSITDKIGGKTAAEILSTPESKVSKLSADAQKLWYKTQSQIISQDATDAAIKASQASEKSLMNVKTNINDFQQNLGQVTRDKAMSLKKPAQQLMKNSSQKYIELTGEAADASPALSKKIPTADLSDAITSKFEYNPEIAQSLKNDLGINSVPEIDPATKLPVIQIKVPTITNQELLNKAREIMQTVSKTARSGSKVYSSAEYQAMQKYSFIMEQLSKNGVDMVEANKFWREWAPVRDRIVREIQPFDETGLKKMPISSTIQKSEATANTASQVTSKLDAQNFVGELETRMKLPKGSIGAEIRQGLEQVNKAKLSKVNLENITSEIQNKIKADKVDALKNMSLKQYDTLRQARVNKIIKRVLIGLGVLAVAKATGVDKVILHTAGSVAVGI